MISLEALMVTAAVVIIVGASVAYCWVFLHAWVFRVDSRRYGRIQKVLKGRLLRSLTKPRVDPALVQELARVPLRHRTRLLVEVGRFVQGDEHERVARIAQDTGVVAHGQRLTGSRRWWIRLQGVRVLNAVGAGHDVVPSLLTDPHSLVRSEAATWCGTYPDPRNVRRLLNLLDSPSMADRISVIDALVAMGRQAVGPLAQRLPSLTPEGRVAGLTAALGIADPVLLPAALEAARDREPRVRRYVARLLSILGGDEAVDALTALLEDPVAAVRAAAARGLGRLGASKTAGPLELLLADPHRDPRRDAALALADLGPPGWILLRETARLGGPAGRLADAVLESLWSLDAPQGSLMVKGGVGG